jgi:hypothetical protein
MPSKTFVLGAGFSTLAGFPLIRDLKDEVLLWIQTERHPSSQPHLTLGDHGYAEGQFRAGLARVPGHEGLGFEELLTALRKRIAAGGRQNPCHVTLRLLRDACSRLFWHRQTSLKLRGPYRNFASWFHEHNGDGQPNAIVSLNWDLVVEAALQHSRVPWEYNSSTCCVPVLKPHGSINWSHPAGRGLIAQSPEWERIEPASPYRYIRHNPFFDPFGVGANQGLRQVIFPGDPEDEDGIARIWEEVAAAIHEREAVVFVGYSLPKYDPEARELFRRAADGKRIEVYARSPATLEHYEETFGELATKDAVSFENSPYAKTRREKAGKRA